MDIKQFFEQNEKKGLLRFLTAGSVDDGKSTLIGRLLHDSKLVYQDHLAALERDSARRGSNDGEIDYALLLDGLLAEREQGITIDVAYRYFSTPRRKFIIADTPGHEQYTRNMATGASNCDLAVILIDARHGVMPQTRRHSFIASLLGIRHIVVAVNKMDAVDYAQEVFEKIRLDYADFAAKLQISDVHLMPISALKGDNVVESGPNLAWYKGAPLLEYLETVYVASDRNFIDLRFPVQSVLRPNADFRGYCGTVTSGVLRPGDQVMVLPSGRESRVKSIVTFDGELPEAFPPMAVTVVLEDDVDVSRGDMLVHIHNVPHLGREFEAMLVWMHEEPMHPNAPYLVKHATSEAPAVVSQLRYRVDVNTLHREEAERLELNEIGRAVVSLHRPLPHDPYSSNRGTGAFVLIDRQTNATVAAGMILDREPDELRGGASEEPRSTNVRSHRSRVTAAALADRLGQQPHTIWLTGLPKSGKSTIAYALEQELFELGYLARVLDGANLRLTISRDLGFSGNDRSENVRRAAAVARLFNDAGLISIAAFVSPYAADRRQARETIGAERFLEVHLAAPLEACEERDEEGLYERARAGDIPLFSGISAPYEEPANAELVLATHEMTAAEAVARIIAELRQRQVIE